MSDEQMSAYVRGARAVQMIRECTLPTTAEVAEKCGLSARQARRMLADLAVEFPIFQEQGCWHWCGDERSWSISDLVLQIEADAALLLALRAELRNVMGG